MFTVSDTVGRTGQMIARLNLLRNKTTTTTLPLNDAGIYNHI